MKIFCLRAVVLLFFFTLAGCSGSKDNSTVKTEISDIVNPEKNLKPSDSDLNTGIIKDIDMEDYDINDDKDSDDTDINDIDLLDKSQHSEDYEVNDI